MPILDKIMDRARARQARVVFPEMNDARVAEAAQRLASEGLCVPVNLGDVRETHVDALVATRGVRDTIARRMLQKPLYLAAAMVTAGDADVMVAGAESPTKRVIEAASIGIGLTEGVTVPSSFFLMLFTDGRDMVFADCAVNVAPDVAALESIARASALSGAALLGDVNVALLSFSTGTSGIGDSVDMVRAVAESTGFTGPVQADAALNADIAARKGFGTGAANVLVFPSLDAGNIAYKMCQEMAGAQALGPFLQGFRRPVCDLSRGASVDDIVAATAVAVAMG